MDSSPMRVNFDVLMILDALDRHGSFATAAESLYKTPAALSYMIQKLESNLDIVLLDRSGHRAKFTDTGRLMLEKGRQLLSAARSGKAGAAAERGLGARAGDRSRCFVSLFCPAAADRRVLCAKSADAPELQSSHPRRFVEELTHHGADIILGAINEPPTSAEWSWQTLGALDNIFVVAPPTRWLRRRSH